MSYDFNRRVDESFLEWKLRLLMAKLNKEVDLDWIEIVDVLGMSCSGDHLRKTAYGIKEYYEYFQDRLERNVSDEDILNELEQKKIEVLEERKKLQAIRVEYNKIAREKARRELIFEHVKESFEKLPNPEFEELNTNSADVKREGVLAFGDIHFGKIFESLNNTYSEDISKERMQKLIDETVKIVNKEGFSKIHVLNGADNLEGMTLRVSQLKSLQSGFIDQVIKFAKFYASWLRELSRYVELEVHQITSSNHTELRPFNSSRGEFPAEDFERIIGMYIQDVLEDNPRIKINIYDKGFADFEILEYNMAALHGHQLKNNKNAIRDLSQLHRKFFDFLYVAHFHHSDQKTVGEAKTHNIEMITIPSVMGSDEYSDSLLTGAKAGANFSVFEKGKGRTISYNIKLN